MKKAIYFIVFFTLNLYSATFYVNGEYDHKLGTCSQYVDQFTGYYQNQCSSYTGSACIFVGGSAPSIPLHFCSGVTSPHPNYFAFAGLLDTTKEIIDVNGTTYIVPKCGENEERGADTECHSIIPAGCNASFPLSDPVGSNCQSSWIVADDGISGKTCYNCDSNTTPPAPPSLDQCENFYTDYSNYCTAMGGTLGSFNCNQIEGQNADTPDYNCDYPDISSDPNSTINNDYNQTTTVFNPDTNQTTTQTVQHTENNGTSTTTIVNDDGTTTTTTTTIIGGGGASSGGGGGSNLVDRDYTDLLNSINQGVKKTNDSINSNMSGTLPIDDDDTSSIDSFIDGIGVVDETNYEQKVQEQFNNIYDSYSSKVLSKFTTWLNSYNLDIINPFVLLNDYYLTHQFETLSIDLSATNISLFQNAPSIDFTEDLVINKLQLLYNITNIVFIFIGVLQGFLIFTRVIAND